MISWVKSKFKRKSILPDTTTYNTVEYFSSPELNETFERIMKEAKEKEEVLIKTANEEIATFEPVTKRILDEAIPKALGTHYTYFVGSYPTEVRNASVGRIINGIIKDEMFNKRIKDVIDE